MNKLDQFIINKELCHIVEISLETLTIHGILKQLLVGHVSTLLKIQE